MTQSVHSSAQKTFCNCCWTFSVFDRFWKTYYHSNSAELLGSLKLNQSWLDKLWPLIVYNNCKRNAQGKICTPVLWQKKTGLGVNIAMRHSLQLPNGPKIENIRIIFGDALFMRNSPNGFLINHNRTKLNRSMLGVPITSREFPEEKQRIRPVIRQKLPAPGNWKNSQRIQFKKYFSR